MKLLAAALAASFSLGQPAVYVPASYRSGDVPGLPPLPAGGGQVLLEVAIDRTGKVAGISTIRDTPPFTSLLRDAVRRWQFRPASMTRGRGGEPIGRIPVPAAALVVAVYRAPALVGPTLGEPSRDVDKPSAAIPYPVRIATPPYPPNARAGGVVLLEVEVTAAGDAGATRVLRSAPPFDDAAVQAMDRWRFTPASAEGRPVASRALVLFGFPAPSS